jgi:enterochelin esterase family protein
MRMFLSTAALLFASSAFAAQGLTGLWTIHTNMNGSEANYVCKLVLADNKITGTCNFADKDRQVTGAVDGNQVTFQFPAPVPGYAFTNVFTGTVDDSGKIAGTFLLPPIGLLKGIFTAVPGMHLPPEGASTGFITFPARDPHTPGYVAAKDLPDGAVPPANADGNFVLGPTHTPAPEAMAQPGVPHGKVISFEMNSSDSKIYPGIARDPGPIGTPDPMDPAKMIVTTSHPAPYTRQVSVYVPSQYKPGTEAPFIVAADGLGFVQIPVLDNLIAQHRIPVMIAIGITSGGGDAQGSERGLEYNTMSGLYAEFVEKEVLPRVEAEAHVKLTHDPDGRATTGGSSGGGCAMTMAWYHPDLYHRVLTYSGTFENQQWPYNPETPHGAWELHEHLIPDSPKKPLRIWMEVGESDVLNPNVMRDNMHDSVVGHERTAIVLAKKGYHYQFVFARKAGHVDGGVIGQTEPEALEYVWQGYPIGKE